MARKAKAGAPKGNSNASKGANARNGKIAFRCTVEQEKNIKRYAKATGRRLDEFLIPHDLK
jgi:uncharacterized protein (DUF1778 family)